MYRNAVNQNDQHLDCGGGSAWVGENHNNWGKASKMENRKLKQGKVLFKISYFYYKYSYTNMDAEVIHPSKKNCLRLPLVVVTSTITITNYNYGSTRYMTHAVSNHANPGCNNFCYVICYAYQVTKQKNSCSDHANVCFVLGESSVIKKWF